MFKSKKKRLPYKIKDSHNMPTGSKKKNTIKKVTKKKTSSKQNLIPKINMSMRDR